MRGVVWPDFVLLPAGAPLVYAFDGHTPLPDHLRPLDAKVVARQPRRLDAQPYPQLVIDAHYERIRREGQVLSTAVRRMELSRDAAAHAALPQG